jgi:hypothetical protein
MVAYRGSKQVGLAPTYRKLRRQLAKSGFTDEGELFIIHVALLEDEEKNHACER